MPKDYSKLKQLLEEQESFPLQFTHKFIGKNSPRFVQGVERLEKQWPALKLQSSRTSKGDAHVALTYVVEVKSADEVIVLLEATGRIEDILVIL